MEGPGGPREQAHGAGGDGGRRAWERFAIIRPHLEEGVCQTEIARVHQLSLRTVQRWVQAYREEGLWGLGTKTRADAGQRRGLPTELVLLIEGLALQAVRRPLRSMHRLVCQVAREQHWKEPRYAQVSRIVGSLPKDLVTLGQAGAEGVSRAL
ncbi:hypothetical protein KDH_00020 [Dictyobacter sp. S3.2.2.5]|uniref:DNA-binding domain-containing protein n=1 Tax=Dictyobacter halimunensis TaxID=3026934 RepID=A0ABQ6FGS7_9CHLR|nr:hypothetical protein KDH_00020 [Dictyobacter sp. S3.2.2.5]